MRTTRQLSITLPNEMANALRERVDSGAYASESEVIRDGLRTLFARDQALESWLRAEFETAYDALVADPDAVLSIGDVRARLSAKYSDPQWRTTVSYSGPSPWTAWGALWLHRRCGFSGDTAAFSESIVAFCESLANFSHRGIARDDLRPGLRTIGYRKRVVIAYAVLNETVAIIGIFSGGRDHERLITTAE
jgi:antitoxin ParD1/3/4